MKFILIILTVALLGFGCSYNSDLVASKNNSESSGISRVDYSSGTIELFFKKSELTNEKLKSVRDSAPHTISAQEVDVDANTIRKLLLSGGTIKISISDSEPQFFKFKPTLSNTRSVLHALSETQASEPGSLAISADSSGVVVARALLYKNYRNLGLYLLEPAPYDLTKFVLIKSDLIDKGHTHPKGWTGRRSAGSAEFL